MGIFSTALLLSSAAVILTPLVSSVPTKQKHSRAYSGSPIYDGSTIASQYDYVIAGGGLGGSVLASRLSEDASRTVLVIEAGYDEEGNADVYDAGRYQSTFGTWLDWQYQTVPQRNGQSQTIRAGRMLGGSTGINGLAWSKPNSFQIDSLEAVGNAGLNWATLQPYMLKAENGIPPTGSQSSGGVTWNPSCHATGGPISIQYDPNSQPGDVERNFNQTVLTGLGLPYAYDLTCGAPSGAAPIANTRSGSRRVDAYAGYLKTKTRPNLTILSGANVGKVILSSGSTPRATGVEFRDEKNNVYTVSALREVIIATGSIKTPAILQQSGIGPRSVLDPLGITVRVELPIGQNLIDQTTTTTNWQFQGQRGGGQDITFPRFQDLFSGTDAQNMRDRLQNNLARYAQEAVDAGASSNADGLRQVLEIQRDWILNKEAGFSESFDYTFDSTLGYDSWYLLPFGRGSVQITSQDLYSSTNLRIDPRFFTNDFDRLAQGATARFTRTISSTSPLKNNVLNEQTPAGDVPQGASLEAWATWAEGHYRSNWHPIGTVAMMSSDLGGSVDSRHRVYGTTGLRVVDGSVLPFQVSSHLMSVLYGICERAADLIKQDNSGNIPTSSSTTSAAPSRTSSAPAVSSSAAPPPAGGRQIKPYLAGNKCFDVKDGQLQNGQQIQLWDCNSNIQQKFQFSTTSSGAVQVQGTNFCLDFGSTPSNGQKLKIWTCYPGIPAQTFSITSTGQISNPSSNQCVDLTDGSTANGNIFQTWACSNGNNNQRFTFA